MRSSANKKIIYRLTGVQYRVNSSYLQRVLFQGEIFDLTYIMREGKCLIVISKWMRWIGIVGMCRMCCVRKDLRSGRSGQESWSLYTEI